MHRSRIPFLLLAAVLAASPAHSAAPAIDPKADAILKQVTGKLAAAKSVVVKGTRTGDSEVLNEGAGTTKFEVGILRPGFIRASVEGDLAFHMVSDGVDLSWFEPNSKTYGVLKSAPAIDGAVDIVKSHLSFGFPVGDLLANEAYARNIRSDTGVTYAGTAQVGGHATDHVRLESPRATVDLFVDQESHLLHKLMVTTKDAKQPYHYEVAFTSWDLDAGLKPSDFVFHKPEGAERIEPPAGAAAKKRVE
jgi:hypothetical protein